MKLKHLKNGGKCTIFTHRNCDVLEDNSEGKVITRKKIKSETLSKKCICRKDEQPTMLKDVEINNRKYEIELKEKKGLILFQTL